MSTRFEMSMINPLVRKAGVRGRHRAGDDSLERVKEPGREKPNHERISRIPLLAMWTAKREVGRQERQRLR